MISIIVPCYNQAHFLPDTLKSVQQQTYNNWECLIIDDGSPDNTKDVAKVFCESDDRFKYHYKKNGGLSSARNYGIKKAQGEYIVFLDSDDLLISSMLKKMLCEVNKNNDLEFIACGWIYASNNLSDFSWKVTPGIGDNLSLFESLCKSNHFACHAIMTKKSLFNNVGLFDETLSACEDWDMWLRIARCEPQYKILNEHLAVYRLAETSMSRDISKFFYSGLKVLERATKEDNRVKKASSDYKNGLQNHFKTAIAKWTVLSIAFSIASNNHSRIKEIVTFILSRYDRILVSNDFINIAHPIFFGSGKVYKKRDWRICLMLYWKPIYKALNLVGTVTNQSNFAIKTIFRISIYRARIIKNKIFDFNDNER